MKVLYTAEATATGGRQGRARTSGGNLDVRLEVPAELGGKGGEATNPEQLFALGYGACFLNALSLIARSRKISARNFSIRTRIDLGQSDDGGFDIQAQLHCEMPDVDVETAESLVRAAYASCPYSRATKGNMDVAFFANEQPLEAAAR